MCNDLSVTTDRPNSSLWQKGKASDQPQGTLRQWHQNPHFSSESEHASTQGETENLFHASPQTWKDSPGGYREGRGQKPMKYARDSHVATCLVQKGDGCQLLWYLEKKQEYTVDLPERQCFSTRSVSQSDTSVQRSLLPVPR